MAAARVTKAAVLKRVMVRSTARQRGTRLGCVGIGIGFRPLIVRCRAPGERPIVAGEGGERGRRGRGGVEGAVRWGVVVVAVRWGGRPPPSRVPLPRCQSNDDRSRP